MLVEISESADVRKILVDKADRFGACVSLVCAVHCMALPFVITTLPLLGIGFLAHHWFEIAMLVFSVTLACASLCWGSRIHGQRRILLLPALALMLFISGHLIPTGIEESALVTLGALCIAAGHLLNRRLCRSCHHCG